MKVNKKIFISALLVLVMLGVMGTVSATDSLDNNNLTAEDAVAVEASDSFDDSLSSANDELLGEGETIIYVDSSYTGDEQGTEEMPFKTISAAASAATGGERIFIKNGEYTETTINSIAKPLTFDGESPGGVIIKTGTASFFNTYNICTNLVFNNLYFKDIACTGANAVITVGGTSESNNVYITNCVFDGCSGRYGAIRIYSKFGDVVVDNCKFLNTKGTNSKYSSAIYFGSSGTNTYTIKNTIINGSSNGGTSSSTYGAIYVDRAAGGPTILDNVTIVDCSFTGANGLISTKGDLNITNSKIIHNNVDVGSLAAGSTIWIQSGTAVPKVNVETTIIVNNTGTNYFVGASGDSVAVSVNYNNIQNNTFNTKFAYSDEYNLDYNYWGSNDQPTGVNVNNWAIDDHGAFKLNDGSDLAKEIPKIDEGPAVDPDTTYVAVDGDDANSGSSDAPVATIAKAVELAKAKNGKIIIKEGTYTENNIVVESDIPISIEGQGNVVIDGDASSNSIFIFHTYAQANFINIKFRNNKPKYGGAIFVNYGAGTSRNVVEMNMTIDRCTFENFESSSRGGSIYAFYTKGNLTVKDSHFINSSAGSWGGAICVGYSAVTDGLNVEISGSTFENCSANNGGACYLQANTLNVVDSLFNNNSANADSGALYIYNSTASIDNCIITNNKAGSKGVAIKESMPTDSSIPITKLTITNSVIENNTGTSETLPAIYVDMTTLDVSYSSLVNDLSLETRTAVGYDAVYGQGIATVNNNWWGTNDPSTKVTGKNITMDNWVIMNVEANVTEAILGDTVKLTVDFNHVNTTDGDIEVLTGGVIARTHTVQLSAGSGTVVPSTLTVKNDASKNAVYTVADMDDIVTVVSEEAVVELNFKPKVPPYYGVIYVSKDGDDDNNNGSKDAPVATIAKAIEYALRTGGSGQIIINTGNYTGTEYKVTKDLTITGNGTVVLDAEGNGRLFNLPSDYTIDKFELNNLILTNSSDSHGSVIYNYAATDLVLNNVTIVNNTKDISSLITTNGNLYIADSTISDNNAGKIITVSGKYVSSAEYTVAIVDTTFENNIAPDYRILEVGTSAGTLTLNLTDSHFINNTGKLGIVSADVKSTINVKGTEFVSNNNTLASGGAISAYKLNVENSSFIDNYAQRSGGAIYVNYNGGDAVITKSRFINNTAGEKGNAIYNSNKLTINYSVLLDDAAGYIIFHDGGENVMNAQYNWWGTNDNPKDLIGVGTYEDYWGDYVDCEFDASNWVVMNVVNNLTSDTLDIEDQMEFTVDFKHYNDTTDTPKELADSIPEVEVTAGATNGEFDNEKVTTEGNVATFIYVPKAVGEETIDIISTNALYTLTFNVTAYPELTVRKEVNGKSVVANNTLVNYTIVVGNMGPGNATEVIVTDSLPDGLIYGDDWGIINANGAEIAKVGDLKWNIANITADKEVSLWILAKTIATGSFTNNVTVTCKENDTAVKDNATVEVVPVKLTVDKSVDVDTVGSNTLVNFTIVVNNVGGVDASDVVVSDDLPTELTFVTASDGYDEAVHSWNCDLAAGKDVTFWIQARTAEIGTWTNNVAVSCKENKTSVEDSASVEVVPVKLTISKTADANIISVWDRVTFTITVTNTAAVDATDVTVTDAVPNGFAFIKSNATGYDKDTGILNIPVLKAGESYVFTVTLNATTNGTLTNDAKVTCSENSTEFSASADVAVIPVVRLSVDKTVNPADAIIGDEITFTVTITNNGPSNATNIMIKDVCDPGLTLVESNLPETVAFLENGKSLSYTLKYKTTALGNYTNNVEIACEQNSTVKSASATVRVFETDIKITKTANVSSVYLDDGLFNFTIHIKNHGEQTATNVNITDALNEAFSVVDAKGPYTMDGNTIIWKVGNLAGEEEYEVWVAVKAKTNGTFTNTASVSCTEEPTLKNSTVEVEVKPVVNLAVEKTVDVEGKTIFIGDDAVFTIKVTNNGISNATNVIVEDIIPDGFKFVKSSDDAYDNATGLLKIGSINVGESYEFTITMEAVSKGTLTNHVSVTCNENSTAASDDATVDVAALVLDVTKTASEMTIGNNSEVTFTIVVNNTAKGTATEVVVSDAIPEGFEFVSANVDPDEIKDNTCTWIIPTLANGTAQTIEVKVRSKETGVWTNVANVTCKQNPEAVSDDASVEVVPVKLIIAKEANKDIVGNNTSVIFIIAVENVGAADATGVVITDALPEGFVFVNASAGYDKATNSWTCDLARDNEATFWIEAKSVAVGKWTNTASVKCNENNTLVEDDATVNVAPVVLDVTKTADALVIGNNSLVNFTIVVANVGGINATGVVITDALPDGLEFVDAADGYDKATNSWTCDLAAGKDVTFWIQAKSLEIGKFTNEVTVNCNENKTLVEGDAAVEVAPVVLDVIKVADALVIGNNSLVNFTIVVRNVGDINATGVVITDALPGGLEFVDAADGYDKATNSWTCDLASDSVARYWIQAKAVEFGEITNEVNVNCSENKTSVKGTAKVQVLPIVLDIIYVAMNGSDSNNGSIEAPVASLEHAVEIAQKGKIIVLEGEYTTADLGIISSDLNITGEGNVVIDAKNKNRLLYVGEDASVVLKNLIMINGASDDESGALLGNSHELTLINCTLANSTAGENNGGAIYNVGKLTIINSTIADNKAKIGGAIFTHKGLTIGPELTIINSTFENNVALGGGNGHGGGAIFAQQIDGMTIENTDFISNEALGESRGGAIFISHSDAAFDITDSQFIANHANGYVNTAGGAIYISGTPLSGKREGKLTITNTLFEENNADASGSAITASDTTVNVANSVIFANKDPDGFAVFGYVNSQDPSTPSITLNDNWWGTNDDPSDFIGGTGKYKPTLERWAILTAENDTPFVEGKTVKITVKLDKYTDGESNGTLVAPISIPRDVVIETTFNSIEGVLENGEFTTDYLVPAGLKYVAASVDIQEIPLFKAMTETVAAVDNITAMEGATVSINVVVKAVDGDIVNVGVVEVFFGDDSVATIPVMGGEAIDEVVIDKKAGIYDITAKYTDESGMFADSEATAVLNVTAKKDADLKIANVSVDSNNFANITATIDKGAKGVIDFTVSGGKAIYSASVTIEDGTAVYAIPKELTRGNYKIIAKFSGNDEYYRDSAMGSFSITQEPAGLIISDISIDELNHVEITANIDKGVEGNITFVVSYGKLVYTGVIPVEDGEAVYAIPDSLSKGNYTVTATFEGNDEYYPDTAADEFEITEEPSNLTISDIAVDGNGVLITATVNEGVAGNVTFTVTDGENTYIEIAPIKDGEAVYEIPDLAKGNYTVTAEFEGEGYYPASDEGSFEITEEPANFTISDIAVDDNAVTITAEVGDGVTGNVTFTVSDGETNYTEVVPIEDGEAVCSISDLAKGNYTVTAEFEGEGYIPASDEGSFEITVESADLAISDITVDGPDVVITATVGDGVEGNVTFTVTDGVNNYTEVVPVEDGEAVCAVYGLPRGNYSVIAEFEGEGYLPASAEDSFEVTEEPVDLIISDIAVDGPDVVITVTVDDGVEGNVTFTVTDGVNNYTEVVPVEDGEAVCAVYGLPRGEYNVTVEFEGESYLPASAEDSFEITEEPVDLIISDIAVDESNNVEITAEVGDGVTGNVTFTVTDGVNNYTEVVPVEDGEAVYSIEGLAKGNYTVTVEFEGEGYLPASAEDSFEITEEPADLSIGDITVDGNDVTITAEVGDGVTGNVTFTVSDGENNYTEVVPIKDGKAVFSIFDLPEGNYTVTVDFEGEGYYPASAMDEFSIEMKDPSLEVFAEVDDEGIVSIYATVDSDATGNVTFIVLTPEDETYLEFDGEIIDGIANEGATYKFDEGEWTVIAKYAGDDKFIADEDETTFDIDKEQSNLVIEDVIIDDDYHATIVAKVDDGVEGNVTFTVSNGETNYTATVPIENGTAVYEVPEPLDNGNYIVSVSFEGDDETYEAHEESSFVVADKTATGLITPSRVIYVSDAVGGYIYQIILKDENGTHLAFEEVTFTFNGITRSAITDADGWAEFNFTANAEGTYNIEVSYAGSNDYKAVSQNGTIKLVKENVKFLAPNRVIYASDLAKGYTYQVILKTKDGKALENRKVLVILNGKKYLAITDENGVATFNLATNNAGEYKLTIRFAGDRYCNAFEDYRTLKAIKEPVYLLAKTASFKDGDTNKQVSATVISKTGTSVANARVTLEVNGVTYAATTNANGVALIKMDLNQKGIFYAKWAFGGTALYDARSATSKIAVS